MKDRRPQCPHCKTRTNVVPSMYGYPSYDAFKMKERGEVKLGGCEVDDSSPRWHCKQCGMDFGKMRLRMEEPPR